MTKTPKQKEHDFEWYLAREEANTVLCRQAYCEQPVGADCIDQAGEPLVCQPAHWVRRQDAAAAAGHPVLPDAPPDVDPEPAPTRQPSPAGKREDCNFCRVPIVWALTRNDALMPVDAEPCDDGNVLLTTDGTQLRAAVFGKRHAAAVRAAGEALHKHHKLSCPYAHRWSSAR